MFFVKHRLAAAGVAFVLAMGLAGCSGGGEGGDNAGDAATTGGEPQSGGTVIRRLGAECKTLNWVLATTQYESQVLRHLYEPLVDVDEHMEYVPVLAESWEVSDDQLRITVKLRPGHFWHDGEPVTSADVEFTMDRILDPAVPAINKEGYFSRLDHLEVVDDLTVVFVWKEPYAPSVFALTQLWPIPAHVYGKGDFLTNPANRKPVGSGPFVFDEWRTSQYISLRRNENYHGKRAYLDRIIFKVIEDDATALNALKAGELDETRLTQIQWEKQTNDDEFNARFNKFHYYIPSYNYLAWNCRSVWFRDRRVRLAMTLLFDRESINAKIYSDFARLVSGPFYVNSWAYDKSVKPHPFDPNRARELLDEAGWTDHDGDGIRDRDGVKFEFQMLITSGSNTAQQFALLLQEECAKAGIKVEIRQLEGSTFFDRVDKGQFDACMLAWILDLDPDVFDTFHSSMVPPEGLNHGFYSNAKVDSLLEAGRVEFDREKRAEIYHQVHRIMHEDPPYTFVNAVPRKRAVARRINGIVVAPTGMFDFWPGANYWYIDEGTASTAAGN
jgi:peptide/nickel transport system substrate-binding protein